MTKKQAVKILTSMQNELRRLADEFEENENLNSNTAYLLANAIDTLQNAIDETDE